MKHKHLYCGVARFFRAPKVSDRKVASLMSVLGNVSVCAWIDTLRKFLHRYFELVCKLSTGEAVLKNSRAERK